MDLNIAKILHRAKQYEKVIFTYSGSRFPISEKKSKEKVIHSYNGYSFPIKNGTKRDVQSVHDYQTYN